MGVDIWALVNTTQGPRKPDKYDRKVSVEDIIVLPDSQLHEIIDLNVICSENEDSEEIQARKYSSKDTSETDAPYTRIDKKRLSLLLDSGCIGRDFISITCVQKLKLNTYSIMYPIDVISIHGNEIATQVVCINNFEINYKDQQIIIPEVNLVVINKAPTDIILGHGSLKMYNVYSRLSRYFGAAHSDVENPAVRESCRSTKPACQRDSVATSMSLSAKVTMGKNATKRVHISKLLKQEDAGDPTEGLLPEDILANYWLYPDQTEEFTFKVKGTEAEQRRLITLINQYRDVFATRLNSAKPARVTPMG